MLQTALTQRLRPNNVQLNSSDILTYADVFTRELTAPAYQHISKKLFEELRAEGVTFEENTDASIDIEFVTYFTDDIKVRSLPYYPGTVLIGIPFATNGLTPRSKRTHAFPMLDKNIEALTFEATIPWNLLQLSHEVAHFLYWNCVAVDDNDDGIADKLQTLGETIREEAN